MGGHRGKPWSMPEHAGWRLPSWLSGPARGDRSDRTRRPRIGAATMASQGWRRCVGDLWSADRGAVQLQGGDDEDDDAGVRGARARSPQACAEYRHAEAAATSSRGSSVSPARPQPTAPTAAAQTIRRSPTIRATASPVRYTRGPSLSSGLLPRPGVCVVGCRAACDRLAEAQQRPERARRQARASLHARARSPNSLAMS